MKVEALFREWLDLLELEGQDDVVVLNWVKELKRELLDNDDVIPERNPWSNFFESVLEWWDVWFLTIWIPQCRTLLVILLISGRERVCSSAHSHIVRSITPGRRSSSLSETL